MASRVMRRQMSGLLELHKEEIINNKVRKSVMEAMFNRKNFSYKTAQFLHYILCCKGFVSAASMRRKLHQNKLADNNDRKHFSV